jgi:hypothetical protein
MSDPPSQDCDCVEALTKWLFIALAAAITFGFGLGAVNIILLIRERLH